MTEIQSRNVTLNELIFYITFRCDKACVMCSVDATDDHRIGHMRYDSFAGLVNALYDLGISHIPTVGFTGGEPLMYNSCQKTLSDLVYKAKILKPDLITVQTSGYGNSVKNFREQVLNCLEAAGDTPIEFSTSYTLYQIHGIKERMEETIHTLVNECPQRYLNVYLTSNIRTWRKTLASFAKLCISMGFTNVDPDYRSGGIRVETKNCTILGVVSGTVPVGRGTALGKKIQLRSNRTPLPIEPCNYLRAHDPTMVVLPDGNVHICCMPEAFANPSFIMNVFDQNPMVFFEKYQELKKLLHTSFNSFSHVKVPFKNCDICNAINHKTLNVIGPT